MNLFNRIEKVNYKSNNPNEFVSLHEYVLFVDDRNGDKYVVFKFINNLNQSVYEAKFEISQYNEKGELLETCKVSFKNFKAKTQETFVPQGKLKVNPEFASLSAKLVSAKFEKMVFENGQCADIPYTFDEYKEEIKKKLIVKEVKKLKKIKEKKKRAKKIGNSKLTRKDIFKKHNVRFPKVLNAIVSIALLVFVGYGALYSRANASYFTVDYINYTYEGDTVRMSEYDNVYGRVTIPEEVNGYKIGSVGNEEGHYVFYNEELYELVVESENLSINEFSFYQCNNLQTIYSEKTVRVRPNAFANCTNLTTIYLPNSTLYNNSFVGCQNSVQVIYINKTVNCYTLGEIFGCSNEELVSLYEVTLTGGTLPSGFFEGLPEHVNIRIM